MYRIMIVEDDLAMAGVMKKQIESWGNQVMCVSDFQNILPAFVEYDPHMVLMDIMLPFFNGYHWCTEIRRISNVPVVFISSASENEYCYGHEYGRGRFHSQAGGSGCDDGENSGTAAPDLRYDGPDSSAGAQGRHIESEQYYPYL